MKIILSNQSEKPIYLQIKEQLEEQILSGEIPEDTVLPSIRKMAADLLVSVITTTRAYKELEADGFITTVPGKGCIVLPPDNKILREQPGQPAALFYQDFTRARFPILQRSGTLVLFPGRDD